MEYCTKHETPMPFAPCTKILQVDQNEKPSGKGKFTIADCGIKKSHPKHAHCTEKLCAEVANLKHPSYKWITRSA